MCLRMRSSQMANSGSSAAAHERHGGRCLEPIGIQPDQFDLVADLLGSDDLAVEPIGIQPNQLALVADVLDKPSNESTSGGQVVVRCRRRR